MANNRIVHKRTSTSGLLPNTTNSSNAAYIAAGELAVNLTDRKVVTSTGSVPFEIGANVTSLYVGTGEITANATHLKLGSAALFANGSNGTSGQVLTSNGTSAYWAAAGGGGTPGGSTTQIQFNDGGAFAGSANLTFDKTTALVTVGNTTVNTQFYGNTGDIRINQITTTALALANNSVGFRGCPHNEQTGDYTFTIHDAGKVVLNTKTTAGVVNWTIPNTATVPFPIGTVIMLDNSYYPAIGPSSNINITSSQNDVVGVRLTGQTESTGSRVTQRRIVRGNSATIRKMGELGSTQSVSSITRVGTTGTLTTSGTNTFVAGDWIFIAGATGTGATQYNGLHRIATITSTTVFTFILPSDPGASASGTITVRRAEFWSISGTYTAV